MDKYFYHECSEQSNKLYHEYFEEEQWLKHFKKENKLDKTISFIQPSRSNLKYLKWSYES